MNQRSVTNNDTRNPGYVLPLQSLHPTCQILDILLPTTPLRNSHHLQELTPGLWILATSREAILLLQAETLAINLVAINLRQHGLLCLQYQLRVPLQMLEGTLSAILDMARLTLNLGLAIGSVNAPHRQQN